MMDFYAITSERIVYLFSMEIGREKESASAPENHALRKQVGIAEIGNAEPETPKPAPVL